MIYFIYFTNGILLVQMYLILRVFNLMIFYFYFLDFSTLILGKDIKFHDLSIPNFILFLKMV